MPLLGTSKFLPLFLFSFFSLSSGYSAPGPPQLSTSKVHHSVVPPRGWTKRGAPPPYQLITLHLGLPQPNFHVLEKHLYEVSDPYHARYGEYLSKEQVETLVAPHPSSVDAVDAWLISHDAQDSFTRSPAKDWVTLTVPISLAEKMLDATYNIWVHDKSGESIIRTTNYSLPLSLHDHIQVVQPTTVFARSNAMRATISWPTDKAIHLEPLSESADDSSDTVDTPYGLIPKSCNHTITISCLKKLYKTEGYTPSAPGNSIAVTGYLGQYANKEDLSSFFEEQAPTAVGSTFREVLINHGKNDQNLDDAGAEANLDVQFAFGLASPIPGTFYSTGGSPPFNPDQHTPSNTNEPYLEWIQYVKSQAKPPLVISTSYGDDEQTVPREYAIRVCHEFAQLGARGVSLIFSSGDSGVGDGNPDPKTHICYTNDKRHAHRFMPAFPASCPFVTAVGGTQYINPEIAVTNYYSGGGFSNYFPRPSYQENAVKRYLNTKVRNGMYNGLFNKTGRAYPDVSAQGDHFRVWYRGYPIPIGGTSASSPTFAGIVALLNDALLQMKKKPLGFLNPLLYSKGIAGLNDILVGHNPGCGTQGFNATRGWDPVTGLGTPNFQKLKGIVIKTRLN